ncbi:MAG: hypothetical protein KA174_03470 [Chitinophagales bacterium]|mgnify:FL=1|jgi:hypothetical protein|nr:hypothetical protein [Chitinophagales bacterium]
MAKITYTNKVDKRVTNVPEKNKVTAADMNEIKTSVNEIYDLLQNAVIPTSFAITESDFDGDIYANSLLVNKTPMSDFYVIANNGSGTLLSITSENFNSNTGTLTILPDNYYITIYKKII